MSETFMNPSPGELQKNRRTGLILALVIVLYIGAVIAFIIAY